MKNSSPTPKPRKPSGFDAITDQTVMTLVQMLSQEQRDLEMAAHAMANRRPEERSESDIARLKGRALAHRAALEKIGNLVRNER